MNKKVNPERLQEEKNFICGKIKDFAVLKCDIANFFEKSPHSDDQLEHLLCELTCSADEFYVDLLSVYGSLVEKEVENE